MICTQILNKRRTLKCGKIFKELAGIPFFISEYEGQHQSNAVIEAKKDNTICDLKCSSV